MPNRDYRDILAGGALILAGLFTTIHTLTSLNLGTVSRMGPGMFPVALGVILTVLGFIVFVPALFRSGEAIPRIDMRPLLAVSGSIFAFAVLVRPFGLVPAIVVLTLIASRADSKLSPIGIVAVAAGLSVGAVLIFQIGLGLQLPTFNWPW